MCNKYCSVANAFVFCCDAKHSDILRGPSHVDCYLFQTKLIRVNRTGNVIQIHNCQRKFLWSTITVSTPRSRTGGSVSAFQQFCWRGSRRNLLEEELDGKGVVSFWRESSGILEVGITNFISQLLFDLIKVQTEKCCIIW